MSEPTATVAEPRAEQHRGLVLAAACVCQVMVVLDISVVNVALPSIARDLDFSPGGLSWVVNAYTLAFGGLLLLGGRAADLVGHRTAMFAGLGLFGLASVVGGFAQNAGELVAARIGQGVAAAVLAPLSLTVITVAFADGKARSRAVGIWATVAALGSALGVLVGGLLTEWLSWRWVLLVNVPIAAAALVFAVVSVRDIHSERLRRLDVLGAVLGTITMASLVNGTIQAGERGWGATSTFTSYAVALLAGAAFAWWETRTVQPLVRFGIFRARTVWVANTVMLFIGAVTIAGSYFSTLFLQDVLHYTPIQAGAAFLPFCLGTVVGARLSSRLVERFGTRTVLTAGLTLCGIGMVLFSRLDVGSTFWSGFMVPSVIASVGLGTCMVANTSLATSGVARHEAGLVSGILNTARQAGGSVGLAVLATIATVSAASDAGTVRSLEALVRGYDRGFLATAAFSFAAAVVAALFAPRARPAGADAA